MFNKFVKKKIILLALCILFGFIVFIFLFKKILIKYGGISKEQRTYNMKVIKGTENEQIEYDYGNELAYALQEYCNWDNAFLSDRFKEKYKNRRNIMPNINKSGYITGNTIDDNYVEIRVDWKEGIFDADKSDALSTVYIYRITTDSANELDDLELVKAVDIYTINAEPVDGSSIEDIYLFEK